MQQARKVPKELLDLKAYREPLAPKVLLDLKAYREPLAPRALKAETVTSAERHSTIYGQQIPSLKILLTVMF